MSQLETQTEVLVNSDIGYVFNDADSEYSKVLERDTANLQSYIYIGEKLIEAKEQVKEAGLSWEQSVRDHSRFKIRQAQKYMKLGKYFSKNAFECVFQGKSIDEVDILIGIGPVSEVKKFLEENPSWEDGSELRKLIKIYKGEVSPEEDSGKGAIPTEDNQPDTETVDVTALENKVSALQMKNSIQKKKIKQLQTENQRLRDENRVLNERGGSLTFNAVLNALCIDGTHVGNIVNYHAGEITQENMSEVFNAYVDNLVEMKKQEELDKLNALGVTG